MPLFEPSAAAPYFQSLVNNMTASASQKTLKIVSPSMANGANPQPGNECTADPAGKQQLQLPLHWLSHRHSIFACCVHELLFATVPGNPNRCTGWMSMFKTTALTLPCTAFDGTKTNCWDVIDSIQIHAYEAKVSLVTRCSPDL